MQNSAFCTLLAPWTQGWGAVQKAGGSPRLLFPGSGLLPSQVSRCAQLPGVHPGPPAQASPPTWKCSRSRGCEGPGRGDHQAAMVLTRVLLWFIPVETGQVHRHTQAHTHTPRETGLETRLSKFYFKCGQEICPCSIFGSVQFSRSVMSDSL